MSCRVLSEGFVELIRNAKEGTVCVQKVVDQAPMNLKTYLRHNLNESLNNLNPGHSKVFNRNWVIQNWVIQNWSFSTVVVHWFAQIPDSKKIQTLSLKF